MPDASSMSSPVLSRARMARGERMFTRLAASSMARGRPSSRAQSWAMARSGVLAQVERRPDRLGSLHEQSRCFRSQYVLALVVGICQP